MDALDSGRRDGLKSNVHTHSPLFYLDVRLDAGTKLDLPREHSERGVYIAKGTLEVDGWSYTTGQMVVFSKTEHPTLVAKSDCILMLLGGESLGERFIWWNFVSSRKERIEQAKADWQAGRIILPPNDNEEFIPLPESKFGTSKPPQPEPLS